MNKYQHIRMAFDASGNPEKAAAMSAYMRNRFTFYGIPTPARRAVCKELLAGEKKTGEVDWAFLRQCWDDPHREFQYLVTDCLAAMKGILTSRDIPAIERFVRSKQWWDTIDALHGIIGHIALSDKSVGNLMLAWSLDDDFWVRRIAIDHQLGRKQNTDTGLLEQILTNNFGSTEFFINKAIGWSLRDFSKTNPQWVRDFIGRHRQSMHSLSIREASRYI